MICPSQSGCSRMLTCCLLHSCLTRPHSSRLWPQWLSLHCAHANGGSSSGAADGMAACHHAVCNCGRERYGGICRAPCMERLHDRRICRVILNAVDKMAITFKYTTLPRSAG